MIKDDRRELLEKLRARKLTVDEAIQGLQGLSYEELPYARVDSDRDARCGFPEVIFCQNKRSSDITSISRSILKNSDYLLATRADRDAYRAVKKVSAKAVYHQRARCVTVQKKRLPKHQGTILVACAGTADVPVGEEAKVTAEIMGHTVETLYDVGVAGIHRLLSAMEIIRHADCIVVVAGMEGALASVVGGLTSTPVVAVPTSVGYGANFGGLAPLLAMLNSCAAGVTVVNIDNGFGAGYAAALITRTKHR